MDTVRAWEAALTALDNDHAERQAWVFKHIPAGCQMPALSELAELRRQTEDAMRAFYFLDATEPDRTTRRSLWRVLPDQRRFA